MDDGIELNFAPAAAGGVVKQSAPKGGRWTDRAKARRDIRKVSHAATKSAAPPPPVKQRETSAPVSRRPQAVPAPPARAAAAQAPRPAPVARSIPAPRPAQAVKATAPRPVQASKPAARQQPTSRPPQLDSDSDDEDAEPQAGPSRLPAGSVAQPKKPAVPQVISSLFTGNSSMPVVKPDAGEPATIGAPSNAPVDTSTFEGLGLNQLLVRHLKGKMAIKAPTGIQRSALPQLLSSPLDIDAAHARVEDEDEDDYEAMTAPKVASTIPPPRDVFIQSQTGSGKTLTYLLPIVQALLPLSRLSYIDRSIGTLAIILAPTRELAQQISKVLEQLLSLSLATEGDDRPMTRWLVSGLLTGGSTKTHEKAKLRKGVPILVATPGRLLDHLQNTTSFRFAKTMFLVLDEADRVMDLGFEETVTGIIKALDGRRRAEMAGEKEAEVGTMRWGFWDRGRQNILCSATVDGKVEKLAGMALRDPVVFRAEASGLASGMEGVKLEDGGDSKKPVDAAVQKAIDAGSSSTAIQLPVTNADKFTPPSQLSQKFIVVPTKLRLVSLVALLRTLVSRRADGQEDKGAKVIVFMSSTDAVDFHWKLLGGVQMGQGESGDADADAEGAESADEDAADGEPSGAKSAKAKKAKANGKKATEEPISLSSPLFPNASIQRLHGSLPLRTRLASLSAFAGASSTPSILICTSVASRGLDMPLVSSVVQYDLPIEGGANEYVHRVGRTARAGKGGEAWAFVGPSEVDWVPWVGEKMGAAEGEEGKKVGLGQVGVEDVLKKGFGGRGWEFERRATEVQGGFERWVIADDKHTNLARKAFSSFIRAYSTHPLEEKRFFHTKSIHLGHLAKAFALREAPGAIAGVSASSKSSKSAFAGSGKPLVGKRGRDDEDGAGSDSDDDAQPKKKGGKELTARNETERRMYEAVRKQGREIKSGGQLGRYGADERGMGKKAGKQTGKGGGGGGGGEFQVMGTGELERMLAGKI